MPDVPFHQPFPGYVSAHREEYMCERQIAHFRARLRMAEFDLMKCMDGQDTQSESLFAAQQADTVATAQIGGVEQLLLQSVQMALLRMEAGEYGYCDGCGVEIGMKRLEAYPAACLCLECKTLETVRIRRGE